MDYHVMMDKILESLKSVQNEAIAWNLYYQKNYIKVYLRCPVLFIIGDTDGHDKLVGKYSNRNNTARLCRYCDCPFDETDDPNYTYTYYKQKDIQKISSIL